ncbi:FtsX-like permease family protein [Arsenicicoccus dermatophilus]|uniref:FtsX-like permease family protein n=1 Tax=Arsenicicoccus dermatophilus TaxID=1076331 RepID=UPI001F4CF581|nr:FtsX-like permease family protein [Arsenicicoccus dermatophilus]MCH8614242.1 hypothetical protein [Arsenicicoccus dermatophilus]
MSSAVARPPRATTSPTPGPERSRSRRAEWLAGWRVALRLARRDTWAHKARSSIVLLMIALPVAVMVAGLTVYATIMVDDDEALDQRMGRAVGIVTTVNSSQITPSLEGEGWFLSDAGAKAPPARPLPGEDGPVTSRSDAGSASDVGRLLGARVLRIGEALMVTEVDGRPRAFRLMTVDGRDGLLRGKVDLVSGRWPTTRDEIVVTERGARLGLPTSGTLTIEERVPTATPQQRRGGARVTVVGVGRATAADGRSHASAVRLPDPSSGSLLAGESLVGRDRPITWAEVKEAATYGVGLQSRAVLQDPPPASELFLREGGRRTGEVLAVALLAAGLLIEASLLAGPAFAVIAQRQRRGLALAAANGATRAQLRRTVLAQALVLGVASATLATVVGVAAGAAAMALTTRRRPTTDVFGPFDVPWRFVAVVLVCAVVASVVAALLPARGLGRLDVTAVMRGEVPTRRVRRAVPASGLVLAALGTVGVFGAVEWLRHRPDDGTLVVTTLVVSAVVLVSGALLAVPAVLALVGRLGANLPVPLRLATRAAARRGGRATSTVAAIMAGAVILSAAGLGLATTTALERERYVPSAPHGWLHSTSLPTSPELAAVVRQALPGGTVHEQRLATVPPLEPARTEPDLRGAMGLPHGCTVARALAAVGETTGPCLVPLAGAMFSTRSTFALDPALLGRLTTLTPAQRAVLDQGGTLTTSEQVARGGTLIWTLVLGQLDGQGQVRQARTTATHVVPVAHLAPEQARFLDPDAAGVGVSLMTVAAARAIGLATEQHRILAHGPDGAAITEEQEEAVRAALDRADPQTLGDGDTSLHGVAVERGFHDPIGWVRLALLSLIGVLVLIATTTATALSMGESRQDLDTLAAVGSTARTRRAVAAAHAAVLALVGTASGLAVGAVPGTAYSRAVVREVYHAGSAIAVPWPEITVALVGIPALAALLATLMVRTEPTLTRRQA